MFDRPEMGPNNLKLDRLHALDDCSFSYGACAKHRPRIHTRMLSDRRRDPRRPACLISPLRQPRFCRVQL